MFERMAHFLGVAAMPGLWFAGVVTVSAQPRRQLQALSKLPLDKTCELDCQPDDNVNVDRLVDKRLAEDLWFCADADSLPGLLESINTRFAKGILFNPELEPLNGPRIVHTSFEVESVWGINTKNQEYKMQFSIMFWWNDCRAVFGGHEASKQTYRLVTSEDQPWWRPSINFKEMREQEPRGGSYWMLVYTGDFFRKVSYQGIFSCKMDLHELPFDVQHCELHIELEHFPQTDVRLNVTSLTTTPEQGFKGAQWEASDFLLEENPTTHSVAGADVTYSQLILSFQLKRDPGYYAITVVVPVVIVWCLSFAGLFLPIEATPARSAMALIPVLIIVNTQNRVLNGLPPISYMFPLRRYITMNNVLLMLNMVEFAIIAWARKYAARKDKELEDKKLRASRASTTEPMGVVMGAADEDTVQEPEKFVRTCVHAFAALVTIPHVEQAWRVVALLMFIVVNIIYAVNMIRKA
eukprot:TRINITY_DN871_c0_g1_i2.p1 TRINITY_DN871_c0_g1~~TRINITY_DN871_c0_g1_i2.p1  ORF type:complete len:466 (+),score=51.53 TRINITY_DN871_c0_g1_i2:84-1481(+)